MIRHDIENFIHALYAGIFNDCINKGCNTSDMTLIFYYDLPMIQRLSMMIFNDVFTFKFIE